jgi:DNA repair photolyase
MKWGSFVEAKQNIAEVLLREIRRKSKGVIGVSTVTDPYQPLEAQLKLTKKCLEILSANKCPTSIQTKSSLVLRDIDIITPQYFDVGVTITTMDEHLAEKLEPKASKPYERARVLGEFNARGVKTWVFFGPIIPGVNDSNEEVRQIVGVAKRTESKLLFDKLNLRDWVLESLNPFLEKMAPTVIEKLPELLAPRSDYWRKTSFTIRSLCRELGVLCEPAFPQDVDYREA